MKRLFWITVVVILVGIFLSHVLAAGADEAEVARRFCAHFLAAEDAAATALMDAALSAALPPAKSREIRDLLTATMGPVEEIGDAWHVDEIQGYRRYRVPVRFGQGVKDLLVAFEPGGKVGGLFTVEHIEPPSRSGPADAETDAAAAEAAGTWVGALSLPGEELAVTVTLLRGASGWSGSVDIPAQGLAGHPLERVEVSAGKASFTLAHLPGTPTFGGTVEGDTLSGTFTQGGLSFAFSLERGVRAELSRPQTPQPPFDYGEEEVTYTNGDIVRAGTLTIPQGAGPFPAVLLLSGSGAQDRDCLLFGHRSFLLIADHLTRAGIAVLRVDDRGVGGSSGDLSGSTLADFAEDALAGVRFLAGRDEIDPARIGLIGHSEGGLVAPLAASRSAAVAFVVILAGPGVPGAEVLDLQMQQHLRLVGVAEGRIESAAVENRKLNRMIVEGATTVAITDQLAALKRAQGDPTPVSPTEVAKMIAPWTRSFLTHDPRPVLAELRVPVLALNGELDFQVDPDRNLGAIRTALADNPDTTLRRLKGLNHLFQNAKTGAFDEYARIEETFDPGALDLIRDWILDHVKPPREPAS